MCVMFPLQLCGVVSARSRVGSEQSAVYMFIYIVLG